MARERMNRTVASVRRWVTEVLLHPLFRRAAVCFGRKAGMCGLPGQVEAPVAWKQKALDDFSAWLTDLPEAPPDPVQADMTGCDLYTLLAEFVALRQELKFQNREQHHALDALEACKQDQQRQAELFRKRTEALDRLEADIRQSCERRIASYFLDVRGALDRGRAACRQAAMTPTGLFKRLPKGFEGIVEGYEMALRRFDRALSHAGIHPVQTVGRPFDPVLMEAVERRFEKGAGADEVIEELVGGFVRGAEVIRPARVIVNDPPKA